jgi:hypothetical protein
MLDLEPATTKLSELLDGVRNEQLPMATPYSGATGGAGSRSACPSVPADAPLLDRLIGLTGRDPAWRPA